MKKITLLFLLVLAVVCSHAQGILGLFGRSADFFTLLDGGKFTEAQAAFDPGVQQKITPEQLQASWKQIIDNLGKLESADPVSTNTQGEYYTVTVEAKFSRATQHFTMVYNKAEKLVGFFLKPNPVQAQYLNPAYADTTRYAEKEILVKTPGHELVGILTTPKNAGNYPLVIFIHGSGAGDMDETLGPNKPFKDLAAGFASKGVASIRYVKRTLRYPNEFSGAFTVKEETTADALAAIALAKTIPGADQKQIYLFGHSLGGMLAPRVAAEADQLAGIILAAAPARQLADLLKEQNAYFYAQSGDTTQASKTQLNALLKDLDRVKITEAGNMKADSVILGLPVAYWTDLNRYNQVETAKKLAKQRILVIQGGNDFQVGEKDYAIWENALGKKKNATLKFYPDLNHLLSSQLEKGTIKQYQTPASVSETLIIDMVSWINDKK